MKISEFLKKLAKQGCVLLRHGGRHDIWECPRTGKRTAIPRHGSKELPKGTEKKILKDLGLR